jgi:hypothetical protein
MLKRIEAKALEIPAGRQIPSDQIPVLLTIFNRPDKTRAAIENLRQVGPKKLFIAADGPRPDCPEDVEKCRLARQAATTIDWTCDIETRFLDDNMGCDPAVSSAIEWFFQKVEYGIILEDDGIPHPHFFAFCGELFEPYSADERIMQISALSPYDPRKYPYDYHFSQMFRCGGTWGTWRRAWKHYTPDMTRYSDNQAFAILGSYNRDYTILIQQYRKFLDFKKGIFNNWDFQWNMACYAQNGLSIVPEKNLMLNIGFDQDSTHTQRMNPVFEDLRIQPLLFPLRHPPLVYADRHPERSLEKRIYRSLSLKSRCIYLMRRALGTIGYLREVMPFR